MLSVEGKESSSGSSGAQRLVTADGTYATQSALSAPGVGTTSKKDDEKRLSSETFTFLLLKLL